MGNVRARKETGKLYLDFHYCGVRCREQTALADTPANRKKVQSLLERVEAKILLGEFNYSEFFPGSRNIQRFAGQARDSAADSDEKCQSQTPPFEQFADQWYAEMRVQWRESHARNVRSILDSSLKPVLSGQPIGAITKADILQLRTEMAQRKGRGESGLMAPKTINSHMMILQMILDEAAERFGFDSPYRNIKPLKQPKTHIEPFSFQEVQTIVSSVRADYSNYYITRFYTGLRTGEVDGLKWKHIDFAAREILVRETLINGRVEYTKTDGSQREIPMFGPVYEALCDQYKATAHLSEYVFCNREGEPLDHNNVTKRVWYPLLEYLGMKKRRPYQTRHTAATLLLASGENPEWVARILGHSSTQMLFKVYSRYIPNLTRMDGSAFERLVGDSSTQTEGGGDADQ